MAQRICFLGRGGSGKSTVAQNLGHALALKGYHVLLVGNDISLSSTVLLRGEADISPALEDYREHYEIDLNDYVIPTPSGVYCLELGSIDPGVGCLARGVTLIDEMLDTQGVSNSLQLDFILYDISGETPCTGYILPIREGVMQRCIINLVQVGYCIRSNTPHQHHTGEAEKRVQHLAAQHLHQNPSHQRSYAGTYSVSD